MFVPADRLQKLAGALTEARRSADKVIELAAALGEARLRIVLLEQELDKLIDKEDLITAWVEKQGVDKAKFAELYNSFSVSTKARKATQLQDAFKVQGVPALGIAGRYYTDGSLAGSMDRALQVTDYLIAEARKGR